ncbi:MAG: Histidine kinase [Methanocella sp. PtaU1.Bin125]|nr:MAG: Histidine kinase [Methanocella sp. PtaU1.Bin125]
MAELTGAAPREMIGQPAKAAALKIYGGPHAMLIDFFDRPAGFLSQAYDRPTAGKDELSGETCILVPGVGASRVYACKASRIYGPSGKPAGYMETLRDVTAIRRAATCKTDIRYVVRTAMDSVPVGLLIIDADGELVDTNEGLLRLWGIAEEEIDIIRNVSGADVCSVFLSRVKDPESYIHRLFEMRLSPVDGARDVVELADGRRLERKLRLVRADGRVTAWVWCFAEVTASPDPVDVFKEIHHQVKNNLQIISSLQSLHSMKIRDQDTKIVFKECQDRIRTIAMIYERAYQSGHLSEVDFSAYVRDLAGLLASAYDDGSGRIRCIVEMPSLALNVEYAVPCGLLLNELFINSFKYAFPGNRSGEIRVTMTDGRGEVRLVVADNGIGLPSIGAWESPQTLGFQLVQGLAAQMAGRVSVIVCNGTRFEIVFPVRSHVQ